MVELFWRSSVFLGSGFAASQRPGMTLMVCGLNATMRDPFKEPRL